MQLEQLLKPFFPIIILLVFAVIVSGYYSFFKNHSLLRYIRKKYPKFYDSFCTSKLHTLRPIQWMKFIWNEEKKEDDTISQYKKILRINTILMITSFGAIIIIFVILYFLVYFLKLS